MDNSKPRYSVKNSYTGVVLASVLLIAFGFLAYWSYTQRNGFFYLAAGLCLFALIAVLMGLYHNVFFEVRIYDNGIFFQSNHKDGKFYEYGEIQEVWKSEGLENGGVTREYYNIKLVNGKVLRYLAYYKDAKGFAYMKRKVTQTACKEATEAAEYTLNNRDLGKSGMVIVSVVWAIMLVYQIAMLMHPAIAKIPIAIGLAVSVIGYIMSMIYFVCFKVVVKTDGFFVQTNPFSKAYYAYEDVVAWETKLKIYRRRKKSNTYRYFFYFWDKAGKKRQFIYNQSVHQHEIEVLMKRLEATNQKNRNQERA